jgi:membrane-bound ClpP family serine protease
MKANWFDSIKQSFLGILLGATVSLVPFYYNTSAQIDQNTAQNNIHSSKIETVENRVKQLEVKGAIDDTEIKQIKATLERIEKKIDAIAEKQAR